jgi:hypothetical protein
MLSYSYSHCEALFAEAIFLVFKGAASLRSARNDAISLS